MLNIISLTTLSAISVVGTLNTMAAVVEFTIDPAASVFTASGTFNGVQLSEQTPGSMRTGFGGVVIAGDLDEVTLALFATSAHAIDQAVPQRPTPNPEDSGFAAFGLMTQAAMVGQAISPLIPFRSISAPSFVRHLRLATEHSRLLTSGSS